MRPVVCDQCARPIPAGCSAFHLEQPWISHVEYGDIVSADLCDVGCLRGFIERSYPQRQPDFAATRALLDAIASTADLDERGCAGEYDNAQDLEAALPYNPPLAVVR